MSWDMWVALALLAFALWSLQIRKRRHSLVYDYQVAGQSYSASRLSLDDESVSTSGEAQAFVHARPLGSVRSVFVRPGDPTGAILSAKASGDRWVPVLSAVSAAAVALGLFGQ